MKTMEDRLIDQINSVKNETDDKQEDQWSDIASAIREGVDSI